MSAINQEPSLIDRAGELRTDPSALAELFKRAKVLSVGGGKVSADLASAKLLYPNTVKSYWLTSMSSHLRKSNS